MAGLEGQIIGGCRILRRLGSGGMGEVYLAEQVRLKRQVAIKLVRPEAEATQSKLSMAERFAREAQAIAAMEHPHILPVYDYGEQDGLAYLVMAYAPDGSLQEALTPGHPSFRFRLPLSLELTGVILDQAAQALQHAHDRGLLHRDVKPANFLLRAGADGGIHLLLADFGLAKFAAGATSSGIYAGTAIYSAPEQIQSQAIAASDQYSLAVMIYLLLTGQPPFSGGLAEVMLHQLQTPPPSMRRYNPAVPAAVDDVVLRALAKKPEDRWPSVAAFAAVYRAALGTQPAPVRASAPSTPAVVIGTPAPMQPVVPFVPLAQPNVPAQPIAPPMQPAVPVQNQAQPAPLLPGQMSPVPLPAQPAFVPGAALTQQARLNPGLPFPAANQQQTVPGSPFDRASFAGAGLIPPPVLPSPGGARRSRRWVGFASLGAVIGVVLLGVLLVNLLGGHAATANNQTNGSPVSGTPGVTTPPVGTSGPHILKVQTGQNVNGDLASCQVSIAQPTATFKQSDEALFVVFTAHANASAFGVAALFNSNQQVVRRPIAEALQLNCADPGNYGLIIVLNQSGKLIPPGNYAVGVSYVTDPNHVPPPEAVAPVTITA